MKKKKRGTNEINHHAAEDPELKQPQTLINSKALMKVTNSSKKNGIQSPRKGT